MSGPTVPNQALLNGINPLAYMGVRPSSPALYLVETRDPLTTDKNYALGTWWMNNNSPYNLWRLVNLNAGIALWILVSASPGNLLSLTSNTGGAVFPLAGNINVVGDGVTITGVGNPATNTITFSLVGGGAAIETETGNSGGAVAPTAGNLNVVGDTTTITVVGNPGTSTLTISTVGTGVMNTLTGNSGGAVPPTAGNINVVGDGVSVNVVGNPGTSTLTISATGITTLNYTDVTTTPYVVLTTDDYISVDSSTIPITIRLPNTNATGRVFIIKDRSGNASANNITVTTVGGAVNIDGATTFVMNTNFESIEVIFNGTSYEVW